MVALSGLGFGSIAVLPLPIATILWNLSTPRFRSLRTGAQRMVGVGPCALPRNKLMGALAQEHGASGDQ